MRSQPWSPQAAIDAMLEDWPEEEVEREISLEAAERRLLEAIDEVLAAIEGGRDGGAG